MNTNLEILETLALKDGRWQNWALHWARLQITAQHFRYPLMQMQLESDMERMARQTHSMGDWRVRLALSATGDVQITAEPLPPNAGPVALRLAHRPISNAVAYSDVVRFKTSVRQHYDAFKPQSTGIFDIVLFNEDGQITEGTRGNIAVLLDGRWVTPPLQCGLLPGVGRALALSQGRLIEQVVTLEQARHASGWAFINSLRGWLDARLIA
ncbi:aminotransferase class IV [Comamonas testosteroni]|uniref:aminotransferase class IV n=1 Tax=Comamonas testosteroni TaxID=285 RepID=UPI002DBF8B4B|nr:aminotransferase class IV [Comamonas testosteroni]MEB5963747.1 aminotransferase class IV [Comamonas testosteroni]